MLQRGFRLVRNVCLSQVSRARSSTVDDNEMQKFKKLATEWWNLNGPMKALHAYNAVRIPFIVNGLKSRNRDCITDDSQILKNQKILDVGCGTGILSERIARMGATTTGIDPCSNLISAAQCHSDLDINLKTLVYRCSTIEEVVDCEPEFYDAVIASEVVEHTLDYKSFISYCCKALRPGGSIFVTTINRTYLSRILGIWAAEYILGIVPKGTHEWNKCVTPTELERSLEENRCTVMARQGVLYNFVANRWHHCSSDKINYLVHAVKY